VWCISSQMEAGEISGAKNVTGVEGDAKLKENEGEAILEYYNTLTWSFDMSVSRNEQIQRGSFPADLELNIKQAHEVTDSQLNVIEKMLPKLQKNGTLCKTELIKMRALKSKMSASFGTLCNMKEFQNDENGDKLTAEKCKEVLDVVKLDVREAMSLIAVAKMLLADCMKGQKSEKPEPKASASASSLGSAGFPAMGSSG
jgi:hypothetical protein